MAGARFEGFSWGTLLGPGEVAFVFLRGWTRGLVALDGRASGRCSQLSARQLF